MSPCDFWNLWLDIVCGDECYQLNEIGLYNKSFGHGQVGDQRIMRGAERGQLGN